MIFLKHFATSTQALLGVGKIYVQRNAKVGDLAHIINERKRWPAGTPLKLYEVHPIAHCGCNHIYDVPFIQEIKPGMIELMKPKMTFAQSEIQDGDIICFQVEMNEKE